MRILAAAWHQKTVHKTRMTEVCESFSRQHELLEELVRGDRRTVVGRESPVFAGLEFGGFFDVPHRVSINKSAIYGLMWNRIGIFWTPVRARPIRLKSSVGKEKRPNNYCSRKRAIGR